MSFFASKSKPKISPDQDRTRIIISFAMAANGQAFAHWLRNQLMLRYHLFGFKTVYMDCVVSREVSGCVHLNELKPGDTEGEHKPGGTTIREDDQRYKNLGTYNAGMFGIVQVEPEGSKNSTTLRRPIGAHRQDWDKLFWNAMLEADAMIMVLNKEYVASKWCLKEWGQFADNNRVRWREGRKRLQGIALELDETAIPIADMQYCVTPLKVKKRVLDYKDKKSARTQKNVFAWDKGDYTLDEADMSRLMKAIGPLK